MAATASKPSASRHHEEEDIPAGCVLSDLDIVRERKADSVVIEPFNQKQVSNASYDVTLGENYYANKEDVSPPGTSAMGRYYCPWNPEHVKARWTEARKADVVKSAENAKELGCRVGDKVIIIPPGSTYLCHTQEFIGGRINVTTMMKTRSGIGRSNLCVCKAAGWGDVGFCNRYTMEVCNSDKYQYAVLVVGQRVAQIVFLRTGVVGQSYHEKGSYQSVSSNDMTAVMAAWKPEMMLPKLKYDDPPVEEPKKTLPLPAEK